MRKIVTDGRTDGRTAGDTETGTDRRTDGDPDGHHHTIICPFRKRAYKILIGAYRCTVTVEYTTFTEIILEIGNATVKTLCMEYLFASGTYPWGKPTLSRPLQIKFHLLPSGILTLLLWG